jgi:autotransporter-associated beta strand protein
MPRTNNKVLASAFATAAALTFAHSASAQWSTFPYVQQMNGDQDSFTPTDNYFRDDAGWPTGGVAQVDYPSTTWGLPPGSNAGGWQGLNDWDTERNGFAQGGDIEEVNSGFGGVNAGDASGHFALLNMADAGSFYATRNGPFGRIARKLDGVPNGANPSGGRFWYNQDIYIDPTRPATDQGLPDFWINTAIGSIANGGSYLTEDSLRVTVNANNTWSVHAAGSAAAGTSDVTIGNIATGQWTRWTVEPHDFGNGLVAFDHNIYGLDGNGQYTVLLGSGTTVDYLDGAIGLWSDVSGPRYQWIFAATDDVPYLYTDNIGWTDGSINIGALDPGAAPAATYYWDVNGSTAGAGGPNASGNWNGSDTNFNTSSSGGAGTLVAAPTAADTVVFSAGSDATGTSTVTITGTAHAGQINFKDGTTSLTGGTLAAGKFDVAAAASASIASAVSAADNGGAVAKTGDGTLTISSNPTWTGGTSVTGGTLKVTRLQENNAVSISGNAKLQVMDSSPTLPSHPAGNDAFVSRPSSLTIANNGAPLGTRVYNGTLDLGNNDLIIDYTGSSPFADLSDMVRSGYNFGDWLGKGITSSTAANPLSNGNFALGIAENSLLVNSFGDGTDPLHPQFSGQTVDNTTVLIKFTHRVDLDLDGFVTGNDAAIFNGAFSEGDGGATWQTGDVDYDGVYSSNDAAIFNSFYDESLAHLPEPGSLSLLGLAALSLGRRRRSR